MDFRTIGNGGVVMKVKVVTGSIYKGEWVDR